MYEANMNWDQRVAIDAAQSERVAFIRRTYLHVAGAIVAFAVLLAALLSFVPQETMVNIFFRSRASWIIVMVAFMGITWLAQTMATSQASVGTQYLGLGLYVVAEAIFFWPLIWLVTTMPNMTGVLPQAIILTLALAGGLTMSVFMTKADFSWMRSALTVGMLVALALVVTSWIFGFSLGVFFIVAMIALMCGFILYETSNVLHHYPVNMHVAAALTIFSSLATLFWYVIRLLMSMRD
ncbi:MAG: Bax inhibitor-1 family protein [Gemmatales bacterium]